MYKVARDRKDHKVHRVILVHKVHKEPKVRRVQLARKDHKARKVVQVLVLMYEDLHRQYRLYLGPEIIKTMLLLLKQMVTFIFGTDRRGIMQVQS